MKEKLLALGAKENPEGFNLNLTTDNNDMSYFVVWINEHPYIENGKLKYLFYNLIFEWSGLFEKLEAKINKNFTTFESIVKCIEDFTKFHKEYL